jgi:hypothetical protein
MSDGWSDLESKLKSAWPFETDADCTHHENFNFLRETCVSLIAALREQDARIAELEQRNLQLQKQAAAGTRDILQCTDQLRIAREAAGEILNITEYAKHRVPLPTIDQLADSIGNIISAALEKIGVKP